MTLFDVDWGKVGTATACLSGLGAAIEAWRRRRREQRSDARLEKQLADEEHIEFALRVLDRSDVREKIVDVIIGSNRARGVFRDDSRSVVTEVLADSPLNDMIRDIREGLNRLQDYMLAQAAASQNPPAQVSSDPMLHVRKE